MTTYGYCRVSTKEQVEGFGLDVQRAALHAWKTPAGVEWVQDIRKGHIWIDEGVSGALLDRPALGDAINTLEPGDTLVVPRLDRLARDLITQELLLRAIRLKGADVVSCVEGENAYLAEDAGDPSRKLIRQILGAVAEYERSMISLRTQAGRRAKKAAGGYAGGQPPYGWRGEGGVLVEVPSEQRVLHQFRSLQAEGFTFEEIAKWTTDQSIYRFTRRNGKDWTRQSVRKVLLRQGTPAGAVGRDGEAVDAAQVDDQVVGLDRDSRQDVGTDGSAPLGL